MYSWMVMHDVVELQWDTNGKCHLAQAQKTWLTAKKQQ